MTSGRVIVKAKPNKDFETFQREFKKRQREFGLNNYQVYFKFEQLNDSFADISCNQRDKVATIRLDNYRHPDRNIKKSAKHEALHLLVSKLQSCAFDRYVSENEIMEATEELVVRLQGLIE